MAKKDKIDNREERVCVSRVKSEYGLSEKDIADLEYLSVRNPHYSSAPMMRLYKEEEIRKIASMKQERLRYERDNHEVIAAEKLQKAKEEKSKMKNIAKSKVGEFVAFGVPEKDSNSIGLPPDVMEQILLHLAWTLEVDGVRGPGIVVRDILNAGMACWDMYKVTHEALAWVGERCCDDLDNAIMWDDVVSKPMTFKLQELRVCARNVGAHVSGTKAEIVVNILGRFGIDKPRCLPAKCLRAVIAEKTNAGLFTSELNTLVQNIKMYRSLPFEYDIFYNWVDKVSWRAYRDIVAEHYPTIDDLREELRRSKERFLEDAEKRRAERLRHACRCGHTPSPSCTNNSCSKCCQRHGQLTCIKHKHVVSKNELTSTMV